MKTSFAPKLIAFCKIFTWATASVGHVVLQEGVAAVGASYRATLQVGHGCDGSPTAGIRVSIPADFYDEFVWRGTTPTKPGPLWFPVVQSCAKGVSAWVEVPASGTATHGLKAPAALLEVLDIQGAGYAH